MKSSPNIRRDTQLLRLDMSPCWVPLAHLLPVLLNGCASLRTVAVGNVGGAGKVHQQFCGLLVYQRPLPVSWNQAFPPLFGPALNSFKSDEFLLGKAFL